MKVKLPTKRDLKAQLDAAILDQSTVIARPDRLNEMVAERLGGKSFEEGSVPEGIFNGMKEATIAYISEFALSSQPHVRALHTHAEGLLLAVTASQPVLTEVQELWKAFTADA